MFHGQPYCERCEYEGPNFMWMPHGRWGYGALVQDLTTLELRVVMVHDNEVFHRGRGRDTPEQEKACEQYIDGVIGGQLRPGERRVFNGEFVSAALAGDPKTATLLPCPRCKELLFWRLTGIS